MIDCAWDSPGVDPYTGTVAAAVARYDMPNEVRAELIRKAARVEFDDVAIISKAGIESRTTVYSDLRDMHFGRNKVCPGFVTRQGWSDSHVERALIYCSKGYCIAVPFVCRNVSLVTQDSPVLGVYEKDTFPAQPGKGSAMPQVFDPHGKVNEIPEPSTLALIGLGLVCMALIRKGRRLQ